MANLESAYGLNLPLWVQYEKYLGALVHGDFGPIVQVQGFYGHPSSSGRVFRFTLQIGAMALILALGLGIPLGIFAALHHNSAADYGAMTLAVIGIAIPSFVVLPFLGLLFALGCIGCRWPAGSPDRSGRWCCRSSPCPCRPWPTLRG